MKRTALAGTHDRVCGGTATQIVSGTNCSVFESEIIVRKAKEAFRIGEFAEGRVLQDGQMVFHAVSAKDLLLI